MKQGFCLKETVRDNFKNQTFSNTVTSFLRKHVSMVLIEITAQYKLEIQAPQALSDSANPIQFNNDDSKPIMKHANSKLQCGLGEKHNILPLSSVFRSQKKASESTKITVLM